MRDTLSPFRRNGPVNRRHPRGKNPHSNMHLRPNVATQRGPIVQARPTKFAACFARSGKAPAPVTSAAVHSSAHRSERRALIGRHRLKPVSTSSRAFSQLLRPFTWRANARPWAVTLQYYRQVYLSRYRLALTPNEKGTTEWHPLCAGSVHKYH